MQVENITQRLLRQIEKSQLLTSRGLRRVAAGAVDQSINPPKFVERGAGGGMQRIQFEHVSFDDYSASGTGDSFERRFALLAAPRQDRDVGAASDQGLRHRAA